MPISRKHSATISLTASILALSLVGCGGSDSGGSSGGSSNNTTPTYIGNREPVYLTAENTMSYFKKLLDFGAPVNPQDLEFSNKIQSKTGALPLLKLQTLLHSTITRKSATTANRRVNESLNCNNNNGRLVISGDVDSNNSGEFRYHFHDCEIEDAQLDGSLEFDIQYEANEGYIKSYRLSYDRLFVSHAQNSGTKRYLYTGTQDYQQSPVAQYGYTYSNKLVANVLERDMQNGKQMFVENLVINTTHERSSITGKIYDGNEGYINITTSNDFRSENSDYLTPRKGKIFIHGASNSIAYVENLHERSYGTYKISLDQQGDGVYELTTHDYLQELIGENPPELQTTQAPVANILYRSDNYHYDDDYYHQPALKRQIRLSGETSYDPDYGGAPEQGEQQSSSASLLKYQWKLESRPADSQTELENPYAGEDQDSTEQAYTYFKADQYGEYQISLKVTDPEGKSDVEILSFDIQNLPPKIQFYDSDQGEYISINPSITRQLGHKVDIRFNVDDWEDDMESGSRTRRNEWNLKRPAGSNSVLNASNTYATLITDKEGQYLITYRVWDSHNNMSEMQLTINVTPNEPPVAVINTHTIIGNGGPIVNQVINLDANGSYDSGSYYLQYQWDIVKAPSGSNAEFNYSNYENAQFTPNVVGEYQVRLSVTDEQGATSTATKTFNVVAN